jgi:serine/threonine protein kinase
MGTFEPEAFGKYFLVDKIATGGMAEIFKAKAFGHGGFEHLVVIKRILSHLSENQDFVEMFVDEAKVSVALQHANIVRVYDFGKVLDNYFIAMECVDGKDARALLRKLGRQREYLPVEHALYVAHEVCRGLSYAHGKTDLRGHPFGIVHRDMSPSNVLISYDGDVKIADFGIAKAEQNTTTTADGVLKGKFEYMSPEQARGESVDPRSDIFSVGILLFEMLTGRRLFKGDSDIATLERIKAAQVRPPSEYSARISAAIDALVLKSLARDRDQRFQTAAEFQTAIRSLLPRPVDVLRDEVGAALREVFRDEREGEVERIESGSVLAKRWRQGAEDSLWEETRTNTQTTLRKPPGTESSAQSPSRTGPIVLLLALVAFLGVGAIGALAAAVVLGSTATPPPSPPSVVAEAGRLNVLVLPAARVYIDDVLRGEGSTLVVEDLPSGRRSVRLEVDGRDPWTTEIDIQSGKLASLQHTFPALPPPPPVVVEPEENRTRSSSRPRSPQKTKPSTAQQPEVVSPPPEPVAKAPDPVAKGPGTVAVGIIGGGWGHVYIDGAQQGQPAPGRYSVPAGPHEIRIVNPDLGLDHRQRVVVEPGGTVKVSARP